MEGDVVILCPGQGAQAVGMGREWASASTAAAAVFREADMILGDRLGAPLSELCFDGPAERLNRTDVSQPAIFACSIACYRGLREFGVIDRVDSTAGLSLGEYTALCIAGVFEFCDALELVALRGRRMQEAAEASRGGMVALVGADEDQAIAIAEMATVQTGDVIVPANFNAPGQIVLSGGAEACERAAALAGDAGLRASPLRVAGAFHSPLMEPAARAMEAALEDVSVQNPNIEVWSNVTGEPHDAENPELLKRRLVQQIVSPVKWAQIGASIGRESSRADTIGYYELAPGTVLRGLMRRIDRDRKVMSHDRPIRTAAPAAGGFV